jgi:hypothetical protein
MVIPVLNSVKAIERWYLTGEEPVLVMCSDMSNGLRELGIIL